MGLSIREAKSTLQGKLWLLDPELGVTEVTQGLSSAP